MDNIQDNLGQGVLYLVGSQGYSAYEIAVQNGFEGTEQEWLATLVGPQGIQGVPGVNGKSAYELAVENGYQGSLEDWINSFLSPDYYYTKTEVDSYITKKYNTIADLINANIDSGNIVLTLGYHSLGDNGGATYIIRDKTEEDVEDHGRYHFLDNGKVAELLLVENDLRPEIFGAYGDDEHDDSDALQNYINDVKTGVNIYLSVPKAVYRITKQIDFKNKGLVGNGFSRQSATYYNMNSIKVMSDGNYYNEDENLNNVALIHVGADIRNLQLCGPGTSSTISGMEVAAFNTTINNVNIQGFYDQIKVLSSTVSFRVTDLMSISCGNAGVHVLDLNNTESTTAYFKNCSWQWGKYPVLFDKYCYGSSFENIIIEYMDYGLTAKCFIGCKFSTMWCERTNRNVTSIRCINSTESQALDRNVYENFYLRDVWKVDDDVRGHAMSSSYGGVQALGDALKVSNNLGHRAVFDYHGIHTEHNVWAGRGARRLTITTQPTETSADLPHTPADLYINAPNGSLYFANNPDTDHTPVTMKRLTGEDSNSAAYFGIDIYTKERKSWTTHDNGSDTDGYFQAPMFLTYDVNKSPTPINNGWTITKDGNNVFTLGRVTGQTKNLTNPHIIVSGIVSNTSLDGLGDSTVIIPTIQLLESSTGSYSTNGTLQGFKIVFKDLTDATVAPMRFTVAFTSSNN